MTLTCGVTLLVYKLGSLYSHGLLIRQRSGVPFDAAATVFAAIAPCSRRPKSRVAYVELHFFFYFNRGSSWLSRCTQRFGESLESFDFRVVWRWVSCAADGGLLGRRVYTGCRHRITQPLAACDICAQTSKGCLIC